MQHNDHGGEGPPLLIFHGLFGSARNWTSIAKELTDCAHVYTFDFRNHGDSPHTDSHTIQDLGDDILYWIAEHKIQEPILLGHSMGGMAVAATALGHPEDIRAAIIVDIAPRHYAPHHQKEFAALKMDVSGYASR
ncbi:MAG: alpha/beta fold hydrolase, partial [Leptospiraceae bacterium]|nr:alpha/beta fold hydrolase [Leptospiraceae bacterium]